MMQNSYPNGRLRIIETNGQEASLAIKNNGQITGLSVVALLANSLLKEPGVALSDAAFSLRCNANSDTFGSGIE